MSGRFSWLFALALGSMVACDNGDDETGTEETGTEIADADGDGVADVDDNCVDVANAGQENSDADAFGDACDNCPDVDNGEQENADGDTFGDACDNCPDVDNEGQEDADEDTFGDVCDNCPDVENEGQENADADTFGDACDNCPDVDNEEQVDGDADTYGDACDNCPDISNEGQENADADAYGDLCDNCPDTDNDDQAESDGDLLGDACDSVVDLVTYTKDTSLSHTDLANADCFGEDSSGDPICVYRGTSGPLMHSNLVGFSDLPVGFRDRDSLTTYDEMGTIGPLVMYRPISVYAETAAGIRQFNAMVTSWQRGRSVEDTSTADEGEKGFSWTRSETLTFSVEVGADPTQPENQDCIAPQVCLTLAGSGIINTRQEDTLGADSPLGTEWVAMSTRDALATGASYGSFLEAAGSVTGVPTFSMHIQGTALYYDIIVAPGASGVSWTRSRALVPGCMDPSAENYNPVATVDHGFCGDYVEFYKPAGADHTSEMYQDCLSDSLCLTRADNSFIFNAVDSDFGDPGTNPSGTSWAYGPTAEAGTYGSFSETVLTFHFWIGATVSLFDIGGDTYHDITLLGWQQGQLPSATGETGSVYWVRKVAE